MRSPFVVVSCNCWLWLMNSISELANIGDSWQWWRWPFLMILMLTTKYEDDAKKLKLCSRHIVFAFLYGKSSKYLRSVLLLSFYAFNFLLWSMNSIPTIVGDGYGDGDNAKKMWITIKITNYHKNYQLP